MSERQKRNKKVGNAIKMLRKRLGLTQKELCKLASTSTYVCGVRHLRDIEHGRVEPGARVLALLLAALRVSLLDFAKMVDGEDMTNFERDFNEIWDIWFKKQHEEGLKLLGILKAKPYCDISLPLVKQHILLCDALVLIDIEGDNCGCLNVLHEAISITLPYLLKKSEFDYGFISSHALTLVEYRILKFLALVESRMGQSQICINLLNAIQESLESEKTDVKIRDRLLSNICYNLSEELIEAEQYTNAFDACEKGIQFCKQINDHKMLPLLYYNEGEALYFLGEHARAEEAFKRSYLASLVIEDEETALQTKETVAEKYQIDIVIH